MTNRMPLKIEYKDFGGRSHSAHVQPLVQKSGVRIFHQLMRAFGSVNRDALTDDASAGIAILQSLDFDAIWAIACELFKYSTIDDTEVKDLESSEIFAGKIGEFYAATFAALGANYPDFFGESTVSKKSISPTGKKAG